MLVKDLIKILKTCNPSDKVYIEWPGTDDYNRYDPWFSEPKVVAKPFNENYNNRVRLVPWDTAEERDYEIIEV